MFDVFVCLIFLALLVYSSSMMLLMTFEMFTILLKSSQLTVHVLCRCNRGIWMSLVLALTFLALALVSSPCPRPQVPCPCPWPQTQSP